MIIIIIHGNREMYVRWLMMIDDIITNKFHHIWSGPEMMMMMMKI